MAAITLNEGLLRHQLTIDSSPLMDTPTKWANLGWWDLAAMPDGGYESACATLACKIAESIELQAHHEILDVAAGYGASCEFWREHFAVTKIDALDRSANAAVALQKLVDLGHVRHFFPIDIANFAKKIPSRYDRIVCIDSAYHFRPFTRLFALAASCLKPGGQLGWSQFIWHHKPHKPTAGLLTILGLEASSVMNAEQSKNILAQHGLKLHSITPASREVMLGFSRFVSLRQSKLTRRQRFSISWNKIKITASILSALYQQGHLGYAMFAAHTLLP